VENIKASPRCAIFSPNTSSGPNWVDFLTTTYNNSLIFTYNLADGGATIDGNLIKPWKPEVQSLTDQIEKRFLPAYGKKPANAHWTAGNSLFAFFIGINDVGNSYWDANTTRVDTAFKEYADLLEKASIDLNWWLVRSDLTKKYRSTQLALVISCL
jgi:hypothetical protein